MADALWRSNVYPMYTSDDFAAFLTFAGPPPEMTQYRLQQNLDERLAYVRLVDQFVHEYFDKHPGTMHVSDEWVKFYTEFIKWYRIRQEMQDEITGHRQGVPTKQQDT